MYQHEPGGDTHGEAAIATCALCRCGAHNIEDDPEACVGCWTCVGRAYIGGEA
jgi:hypothetical protein